MTQHQLSNKFNDSGIKMFKLLNLLYQGEAEFKDVIQIFLDDKTSNSNANVNLCKYLNSLKVFGIRVEKYKDKYKAYNLPYTYNFSKEELEAVQKIKNCSDLILSKKAKPDFDKFMDALTARFDDETQQIAKEVETDEELDFSFFFRSIKDKLAECERYIFDSQILNITYIEKGTKEAKISGKPTDIIYGKRNASLRIYNNKTQQLYDIPIKSIRSVEQTPQRTEIPATDTVHVVFKLSGRLAKNYRLRENEYSRGIDPFDGRLVVVNKNEDISELLHRLMRYGTGCEVTNPKFVRQKMIELIDETIENYS